ncbi:MAG: AAA family ATPase [Ardenticatenales bacterium]|nr:AAA family ATPase [Ardenticatenales bacterium]
MRCPSCQTIWPAELVGLLRFCGMCRAPMEQAQSDEMPRGELRFATVLFADLVDFTSFSETRPPDEVGRLLSDLFLRLTRVVEQTNGVVEKFIGDALMATFGLPRTDPAAMRNAVRAGLAIRAATTLFCQEQGVEIQIRVGIHTGEMMFCPIGANWTVLGDAVNTASRLESNAPPGAVWISRSVYQEVRRYFTMLLRPLIILKGKQHSVQPYEVVSERETPLMETPRFVGREGEWAQIQEVLHSAIQEQSARLLLIRGSAGVGKSRMLWELREWLENQEEAYRLDVVQYDHSERLPAHGLNLLLRSRFDLMVGEMDEERLLQQLHDRFPRRNPFVEPEQRALALEFFAFVLSIFRPWFQSAAMDGKSRWENTFIELKRWMEGWAEQTPWVWFLEDAQKGDPETAAFIDWALRMEWHAPLLLVVTLREEDFSPASSWYQPLARWLALPQVTEVRLQELSPEVLAHALGTMVTGGLSDGMAQRIAEHTEGNPLFATELLLLLQDRGLLGSEEGLAEVALPGTIREVLEARIERLGPTGKEVAKRGALIGRRFTQEVVGRLWERAEQELIDGLIILHDTETIYEEPSRLFSGEMEQVFRHGRLQEAALARIPTEERLRWLARLEQWGRERLEALGSQWESSGVRYLPFIARALEERGEVAEASLWYELLGLIHLRHHRAQEGVEALGKAFEQAVGVRRAVLCRRIAEAQDFTGGTEQALQTIDALGPVEDAPPMEMDDNLGEKLTALLPRSLEDWRKVNLDEALLSLQFSRTGKLVSLGRHAEAEASYGRIATELDSLQGSHTTQLWLRWGQGWSWMLTETLSRPLEAESVCQRLRGRLDLTDPSLQEDILNFLNAEGMVALRLGRMNEAREIADLRLHGMQERGDRAGEAQAWNAKGIAHQGLGEMRQARHCYEHFLALSQQIGNRRGEVIARYNLGIALGELGEWEAAEEQLDQYLALSRLIGNQVAESYSRATLSMIVLSQGNVQRAGTLANRARDIAEQRGWQRLLAMTEATQGLVELHQWMESQDLSHLHTLREVMEPDEELWSYTDEAGEFYTALIVATALVGTRTEPTTLLARARARIDRAALVAHIWLDMSEAIIAGKPPTGALQWLNERGLIRAAQVGERLWQAVEAGKGTSA